MGIKILAFGQVEEILGKHEMEFSLLKDTDALKLELHARYANLNNLNYVIAVNKKTINGNAVLHENDVVALLPAFSGG